MKEPTSAVFCLVLLSYMLAEISAEEHLVKLNHGGDIRGKTLATQKGRTIYAFRAIPYAEPPVGQLRFKKPISKTPWKDEPIDATEDAPFCVQPNQQDIVGQEDCLHLNVYTPKLPDVNHTITKMAVMVFIHGGGFFSGSSSSGMYDPNRLLDEDIILVTINYRLGPLGFLSTGDSASPGNYGLMDQSLALQWVKEHIEVFGGDANEITIFGESAGGASVGFHLLSPMSSGLFHSAIAQSGSPLSRWAFQENPIYWAKKLAVDLECTTQDIVEMVECLRQIPAVQLVKMSSGYNKLGLITTTFVPSFDNSFLPKKPRQIISSQEANWVPYISGVNKDEGLLIYGNLYLNTNLSKAESMTEDFIKDVLDEERYADEATKLIMNKYFSENDWSNETSTRHAIVKVFTDVLFRIPHYEMMNLLAKENFNLYSYSLDYSPSVGLLEYRGIRPKEKWEDGKMAVNAEMAGNAGRDTTLIFNQGGVCHGDDIGLLFDGPHGMLKKPTEDDQKIINIILSAWTNFAKYNNPTPNSDEEPTLQWAQSDVHDIEIYHINNPVATSTYDTNKDPLYKFWTKTVPQHLTNTGHDIP